MSDLGQSGDGILGVLGGMGPLASAHFMVRLTELTRADLDQDHLPAILWSDPRVPSRGGDADPLPALLRGVRGLRTAGCGAIVIPCNTAHGWYDAMAADLAPWGVPILHIVDAARVALSLVQPSGTVGILATPTTLAMRLYQDRLETQGWTCIVPDPAEMRDRVAPAIAEVKAGRSRAAHAPLAAAVGRLRDRGAGAVILGCTEIPLGLQVGPHDLGIPLVDTIDALALAAIAWSGREASGP